ncbi:GIY-YIG nuclease family protein [Anaerobacillus alkaliphilus]|uniref:GIY-YIG nuclease family protein n=1 Tax=Anaerobacillus alkaliphilus TaxID=1548597 RepID=A0A4Q0VNM0_9BACI|nr:GIY-YIG nuclease family protein [Anaerobacillus alkaliphilus]RXI96432.1 GIY-YIG nuclease family protein [Anaerobacillus alkaliphilus]
MKRSKAKTIQIFLPDGNPRGVKIAGVTNRTVQAILIPRNLLKTVKDRSEVDNVSLYFLFGNNEEETRTEAYIGEAEVGYERLKQHHSSKDFWKVAVLVVTNNIQNQFTKADVKFLEHLAYKEAVSAGRYAINQTLPTNPFIPEWRQEDLFDIFETISLLLGTLGYPIFESFRGNTEEVLEDDEELFYCTRRDTEAFGKWTDDGFVIYKGSKMSSSALPGFENKLEKHNEKIENFLQEGILGKENGRYIFMKDQPFPTPSAASTFVLQSASNGWTDWKDKSGKTLDELKRKQL